MNNLFQYVPGNSILHRMNPVTKIALTIAICAAAFISGNMFYLAGLLAVDLLIGFIAMGFISGNGIAGSFMQGLGSYIVVMLLPLLMIRHMKSAER